MTDLFADAHAVVLPFRSVTTSSSVLLALASGRPVALPALAAFADIPDDAVIRYPPGLEGLGEALDRIVCAADDELAAIGAAGRSFALRNSWDQVARRIGMAFGDLLGGR